MDLKRELDLLGRRIINDAKRNASKNKDTGNLDKSLDYSVDINNDNDFTITLKEAYYGKYLNNKTGYMDRAIDRNLPRGLDSIVEEITDEILKNI